MAEEILERTGMTGTDAFVPEILLLAGMQFNRQLLIELRDLLSKVSAADHDHHGQGSAKRSRCGHWMRHVHSESREDGY